MNFTKIESERLLLRPLNQDDAPAIFEYRSLPEVYKYQGWRPTKLDEAKKFIAKYNKIEADNWMQLAITLINNGKLIGDCGMHFIDDKFQQIEIGFSLSPAFQRKGYGTEAVKCLIDFIFITLKAHRVYGSCDPNNISSIKLMERIGMRKEAHMRESIWLNNQWVDDVIYAILNDEWELRLK